jgi:hypothetical protein
VAKRSRTLTEGPSPFEAPTLTVEEATAALVEPTTRWWRGAEAYARNPCGKPPRGLLLSDLAVGKTELALQLAGNYLHHERTARVVYHVPNMGLGHELETGHATFTAVSGFTCRCSCISAMISRTRTRPSSLCAGSIMR